MRNKNRISSTLDWDLEGLSPAIKRGIHKQMEEGYRKHGSVNISSSDEIAKLMMDAQRF